MQSPHDTLFAFTFRHAHHAAGWLRSVLPPPLATAIHWTTLQPLRERFPGARLRPHVADAGFAATADLDGEEHDLLLLVEHKSFDDRDLAQQLLRYSIHLQRSLQCGPGRRPFVLPVVLRHGRDASRTPRPTADLLATVLELQPRQHLFVHDLDAGPETDLAARGLTPLAELTLCCLRALPTAGPDEVPQCFDRWQHLLRAVDTVDAPPDAPPLGPDAVDAIGWYALGVTEVDSLVLAETFSRILHRSDLTIMSTLERTFQKGLAQGLTQGQARTLLQLLTVRFGAVDETTAERVRGASSADLERWTAYVLTAETLAAVFDTELRD